MSIEHDLVTLKKYRSDYEKLYDMLIYSYNVFLDNQTENNLNQLIAIFEKNELMKLTLDVSGTITRANRILEILAEEKRLGYLFFSKGVTTFDELMDKFMCTIFAIRRMEFEPSDEMVEEAGYYLLQNNISPCAVGKILTEEMICDTQKTFIKIIDLYEANGNRDFDRYLQDIR